MRLATALRIISIPTRGLITGRIVRCPSSTQNAMGSLSTFPSWLDLETPNVARAMPNRCGN